MSNILLSISAVLVLVAIILMIYKIVITILRIRKELKEQKQKEVEKQQQLLEERMIADCMEDVNQKPSSYIMGCDCGVSDKYRCQIYHVDMKDNIEKLLCLECIREYCEKGYIVSF